ncbi:DUF2850 domain-containing protein [Vibrio sinensis]|uniref:DUF2850 domain-containing protein n=2 Tax=Vibrio sinensis TaxID=2302434 RepID=A0A3A6QZN4_9VIBR|nr:DUF2850 domain-containing protein [Vibrio sinensis]
MVSKVNSQTKPRSRFRSRNKLSIKEIFMWLIIIVLFVGMLKVTTLLAKTYQENQHPDSEVYGVWQEKDVAPYAAEQLIFTQDGVVFEGGVIDTNFYFDGKYLEYQHGDTLRRFKFLNKDLTEMKMLLSSGYQPVFQMSEKFQNNIR